MIFFAVLVVGIQLGLVGISEALDAAGETRPDFLPDLAVGLVTLAACIGFSIWGRGVLRLVSTLIGLVIGVAIALPAGVIGAPTFATPGAASDTSGKTGSTSRSTLSPATRSRPCR